GTYYLRVPPSEFSQVDLLQVFDSQNASINDIELSPDGRHVYAISDGDGLVVLGRHPVTGSLTVLQTLKDSDLGGTSVGFQAPGGWIVNLSPDGLNVYTFDGHNQSLYVHTRDPSTGLLTFQESLENFSSGDSPVYNLAVSPDGRDLYAVGKSVAVFRRVPETGSLTFQERVDLSTDDWQEYTEATFSPDGRNVYFWGYDTALLVYGRDLETGELELQQTLATGSTLAISPDGRNVYAGNSDYGELVVYQRSPTGLLTPVNVYLNENHYLNYIEGLDHLIDMTVSPDGLHVYALNSDFQNSSSLSVFERDPASGLLTIQVAVRDGIEDVDGFSSARQVIVSLDGANVYVTLNAEAENLSVFSTAGLLKIAIDAPDKRHTHESKTAPDRDTIHGGDGDDTIVGNHQLDRLFGDSGADTFTGEPIEVRDRDVADATLTSVLHSETSYYGDPILRLDPVIEIADAKFAGAIAEALGLAVTTDFQGEPLVHSAFFASQLFAITALDASAHELSDLSGIEALVNLELLDLSNNPGISDITALAALNHLRSLKLEGTTVDPLATANLELLERLTHLEFLTLPIEGLSPGQNLVSDKGDLVSIPFSAPGIEFDGNATSHVDLPYTVMNGLTDMTVSVWVQTTKDVGAIISAAKSDASNNEFLLWITAANQVQLLAQGQVLTWTLSDPIADGEAHHLVLVRNASSAYASLYVDGVRQSPNFTGLSAAPLQIAPGGLLLGQEQDSVGGGFDVTQAFEGRMDHLAVWNRTLESAEIAEAMNQPTNLPSGLVAYWPFDETDGATTPDAVGSADATLAGVNSWSITGSAHATGAGSPIAFTAENSGLAIAVVRGRQIPIFIRNGGPGIQTLNGPDLIAQAGDELSFDASDVIAATYLWEVSSNNGQVISPSTAMDFSFAPAYSGVYTVSLTATAADGGSSSLTRIYTVLPVLSIAASGDFQPGAAIQLDASGSTPQGPLGDSDLSVERQYLWSSDAAGDLSDENAATAQFVFTNSGEHTFTLTVTDVFKKAGQETHALVSSEQYVATVNEDGGVSITATLADDVVTVTASDLPAIADLGVRSYVWLVNGEDSGTVDSFNPAIFRFSPTEGGDFVVSLTVTDAFGDELIERTASTTIAIENANEAPILQLSIGPIVIDELPSQSGSEIPPLELNAHFRDPDNDSLTYTLVNPAAGQPVAEIYGDVLVVFVPEGFSGTLPLTVRATDPDGLFVDAPVTVIVRPAHAPADRNKDWQIDASELAEFAETWKRGASWDWDVTLDVNSADFAQYVLDSIAIWKAGGDYHRVADQGAPPAPANWQIGLGGREAARSDVSTPAPTAAALPTAYPQQSLAPLAYTSPFDLLWDDSDDDEEDERDSLSVYVD
ncbi:MAG: 6-phosphogluconolactonase (cycloisomerase 2 family), partial [Rhodothermales bacterium]